MIHSTKSEMERKLIAEKITKTKNSSLKRIYLLGTEFLNTKFKIGNKFSYEIDFKNKSIKIVPSKFGFKGTVSKRKQKTKNGEVFVPVLDINNKEIENLFKNINKCKVSVYEDEVFIEPFEPISTMDLSDLSYKSSTMSTLIDLLAYKSTAKTKVYKFSKTQLNDFCLKNAVGFNENNSNLHGGFSFSEDSTTQNFISTNDISNHISTLNNVLDVFSLFTGVGAFEKALTNAGVNYNLKGFSEINSFAVKSFCAIHGIDPKLNYGDITKIDLKTLPDFKLLVGGKQLL